MVGHAQDPAELQLTVLRLPLPVSLELLLLMLVGLFAPPWSQQLPAIPAYVLEMVSRNKLYRSGDYQYHFVYPVTLFEDRQLY